MAFKDRENLRNAAFASRFGLSTMAIRVEHVSNVPKFYSRMAESSKKTDFYMLRYYNTLLKMIIWISEISAICIFTFITWGSEGIKIIYYRNQSFPTNYINDSFILSDIVFHFFLNKGIVFKNIL